MAAEIPCALFLIYSLYRIIADGLYIGESTVTTVLYLMLYLAMWMLLAAVGFAVYSLIIMLILSILSLVSLFGDILFEFVESLLNKRKEQGSIEAEEGFDRGNMRDEKRKEKEREEFRRMYREANACYERERARKEQERRENTSHVHRNNRKGNEIQRAKAFFGLSDTFTSGELKTSRNCLMRKYHPDNQEGNSAMARKINEYYELLSPYAKKS